MFLDRLLGLMRRHEKRVFCWRCGRFVRGLDEWEYEEYSQIVAEYKRAINDANDRGQLTEILWAERRRRLEEACRRLSGEEGMEPFHLFKHRLRSYGPPCKACGRNLRTPKAARCMACGHEKGA